MTDQPQIYRRGVKARNIKGIIRKKVDDWLSTIQDVGVKQEVSNRIIVTGGSIASMLLGEPVSDFDIYFRDQYVVKRIADYYVNLFKPEGHDVRVVDDGDRVMIVVRSTGVAGEEIISDPADIEDAYEETQQAALDTEEKDPTKKYRPVFMSTNAITLANRVQLILRFYGEPDEIHETYDYVHCTNYWTSWNNQLVLRPAAMESLLARELRYVGSQYPVCSVIRMRKFLSRGWIINAGQVVKMAYQISELDLTDLDVLRDQLTGVDVSYFVELCDKLKEKDPDKVDAAYLVEIIDRIF